MALLIMRIVYVGPFRLPDGDAAAARVLGVAKSIRGVGEITVEFLSWGGRYRQQDRCPDGKYRVDGFVYDITDEIDNQGGFISKVLCSIERGKRSIDSLKRKEKFDAIILYNPTFLPLLRLLRYAKHNRIKVIVDLTEWYSPSELHFTDVLPYEYTMRRILKKVKNKICISTFFSRYYSESNNILIPATCDPNDEKWKHPYQIPVSPFDGITIVYAGVPAKKDLLTPVIDSVSNLALEGKPIRLIIVGITKEMYERRFSPLDPDANNSVIFIERQPQQKVPSFYAESDFMVLLREPTKKSNAGFPTKVAEALSAGCPVITNATSDLPLYIKNGVNGFVLHDNDSSSLCELLRKITALPRTRIEDIKMNAKRSASVFSYQEYVLPVGRFLGKLE